ncbi:MAG: hypothetical protein JOZ51_13775, partial [Chloroflexi bacterium]|nr:hypothetical protein [Chloroflexota bacterium]
MSTGAELQILAAPVALGAAATLAVAAGIVIVGGVVVVGAARLGVAAGSYAADRVRERATVCQQEYGEFQRLHREFVAQEQRKQNKRVRLRQLTASTVEAQRAAAPQVIRSPLHENPLVDEVVMERLLATLKAQQARYDQQVRLIEQRAVLDALLNTSGDAVPSPTAELARQAVETGDAAAVSEAIAAVRRAIAEAGAAELLQEQALLQEHHAEVGALLATVFDPAIRQELLQWQYGLHALLRSRDINALRNTREAGELLLARLEDKHLAMLEALRDAEFAPLWGQLQAVGGLFSDLQALATEQSPIVEAAAVEQLHAIGAQYEALAGDPQIEPTKLQREAAKLQRELHTLEAIGLRQLNTYYAQRMGHEIEQSLHEMQEDGFDFKVTRTIGDDGSMQVKAKQGERRLNLTVRDGKLKYDAYGFGDEQCVEAVYSLIDRLIDKGIQLRGAEPQLTAQIETTRAVIEAIKQLNHYSDDSISIREDVDAVVIEASNGAVGFQRITVDEDGQVTVKAIAANAPVPSEQQIQDK